VALRQRETRDAAWLNYTQLTASESQIRAFKSTSNAPASQEFALPRLSSFIFVNGHWHGGTGLVFRSLAAADRGVVAPCMCPGFEGEALYCLKPIARQWPAWLGPVPATLDFGALARMPPLAARTAIMRQLYRTCWARSPAADSTAAALGAAQVLVLKSASIGTALARAPSWGGWTGEAADQQQVSTVRCVMP
jgi:hypothetical protein